jgi:hypothetical protein
MSAFIMDPAVMGAITKAERGIAFLKISNLTSDHVRSAVEHLKSAAVIAKAHQTLLNELETEFPAPGVALFDEKGAPLPGAVVATALTTDDVVLAMTGKDYDRLNWKEQQSLEADLWFAVRTHMRSRALPAELFREVSDLCEDEFGGMSTDIWDWLVDQVKTSGTFVWSYLCAQDDCQRPREADEEYCPECNSAERREEYEAKEKARKDALKAAKPKAVKKPKASASARPVPSAAEFLAGEGGEA